MVNYMCYMDMLFCRNCELTSCTARLPGEPGYLVTSSGLRSLCHICSRSVGVRAATISSCVRVTARWWSWAEPEETIEMTPEWVINRFERNRVHSDRYDWDVLLSAHTTHAPVYSASACHDAVSDQQLPCLRVGKSFCVTWHSIQIDFSVTRLAHATGILSLLDLFHCMKIHPKKDFSSTSSTSQCQRNKSHMLK